MLLEQFYLLPGRFDAERKTVQEDSRVDHDLDGNSYPEAESTIFVTSDVMSEVGGVLIGKDAVGLFKCALNLRHHQGG
jgi:hypothetical protein